MSATPDSHGRYAQRTGEMNPEALVTDQQVGLPQQLQSSFQLVTRSLDDGRCQPLLEKFSGEFYANRRVIWALQDAKLGTGIHASTKFRDCGGQFVRRIDP